MLTVKFTIKVNKDNKDEVIDIIAGYGIGIDEERQGVPLDYVCLECDGYYSDVKECLEDLDGRDIHTMLLL